MNESAIHKWVTNALKAGGEAFLLITSLKQKYIGTALQFTRFFITTSVHVARNLLTKSYFIKTQSKPRKDYDMNYYWNQNFQFCICYSGAYDGPWIVIKRQSTERRKTTPIKTATHIANNSQSCKDSQSWAINFSPEQGLARWKGILRGMALGGVKVDWQQNWTAVSGVICPKMFQRTKSSPCDVFPIRGRSNKIILKV